jgi:hypothetical protein
MTGTKNQSARPERAPTHTTNYMESWDQILTACFHVKGACTRCVSSRVLLMHALGLLSLSYLA